MKLLLSSKVCKKCWLDSHGGDASWWSDADQVEFDKGYGVCCPSKVTANISRDGHPAKPPPEHCPYKFEHAVGVGADNAK